MRHKILDFFKNKVKVIIVLFMVLALLLGYFIGRINNSRDRAITTLEIALKNDDIKALSNIVRLNDKKVPKEKLEPLIKYYDKNSKAIDSDMKKLRNEMDTAAFIVNEKKGIFKNHYNIELKAYNVKVNSNYDEGKFTIDNKNYISSGESIENVIPGVYTISGILKSEYGDVESSKDLVLMKDEDMQLNFNAVNITVQSKFEDAYVYINNKYTGMTVDEAKDIGPFKDDGTVSIYIEKEFPWGTIKGEESCVTDVPVVNLSINMENDKMKKDVKTIAESFYKSVFKALNEEEKANIKDAEDLAIDKIYSILEKKYTFLKNKYDVDNIEIMDDKSEYIYENGIYEVNIPIRVSYTIEKSILGFGKEENSKVFFTKFIYNDDSERWMVKDVENFSL